jgi:hypothetical protein
VSIDYHVDYESHYYSVPHGTNNRSLPARAANHFARAQLRPRQTHDQARAHAQSTSAPSGVVAVAHDSGGERDRSADRGAVRGHLEGTTLSRAGLSILSVDPAPGKKYGAERLEVACARAVAIGARSYRHVQSSLSQRLDQVEQQEAPGAAPRHHENVRGRGHYQGLITVRLAIARAIAAWLPRCPFCHRARSRASRPNLARFG